jgi:hypothetical protein
MPPTQEPTRPPTPMFVFDHGSLGFQCGSSPVEPGWLEMTIEDDEVEIVIVGSPAKLTAIGLNIAAMVANQVAE